MVCTQTPHLPLGLVHNPKATPANHSSNLQRIPGDLQTLQQLPLRVQESTPTQHLQPKRVGKQIHAALSAHAPAHVRSRYIKTCPVQRDADTIQTTPRLTSLCALHAGMQPGGCYAAVNARMDRWRHCKPQPTRHVMTHYMTLHDRLHGT